MTGLFIAASVKLPPEKFASTSKEGGPQEVPTEPKKFILNSAEELFAELRDKNFNAVGATLSKKAKLITAQFDVSRTYDTTIYHIINNRHTCMYAYTQGIGPLLGQRHMTLYLWRY